MVTNGFTDAIGALAVPLLTAVSLAWAADSLLLAGLPAGSFRRVSAVPFAIFLAVASYLDPF